MLLWAGVPGEIANFELNLSLSKGDEIVGNSRDVEKRHSSERGVRIFQENITSACKNINNIISG